VPLPQPVPEVHIERRPYAVYLDAGGRLAGVSYQTSNRVNGIGVTSVTAGDKLTPGFDLRVGVAGAWLFAQAAVSHASGGDAQVSHALTAFGGDGGAVVRFNRAFELAAGLGLYVSRMDVSSYAFGPSAVSQSTWKMAPELMAALRLTPAIGGRFRLRATLEGRYRLASFDTSMVNSQYVDSVNTGFAFAMLLGMELPFGGGGSP
jgi:hypothetical protein